MIEYGAVVPIVYMATDYMKAAGVPREWLPRITPIIGVIAAIVIAYLSGGDLRAAVLGLFLGPASSGFYDMMKMLKNRSNADDELANIG